MNGTAARFLRLGVSFSGLLVLGWVLNGQAAKPAQEGVPTDWTHRHLIFSQPSTNEQVRQVTDDPRYWQQFYRQTARRVLSDRAIPGNEASLSVVPGARNSGAQRDWSQDLGTGATGGAGNYPAKYSFKITTANCGDTSTPDYVVFNTGLLGSATQASVAAFDNLYSGCTGISPTVYWAYNTAGQVLTSPVISGDGKQVAFVQTDASLEGTLILLKWAAGAGTVASPVTPTAVPNSTYYLCTAPCMTSIILKDNLGMPTDDRTSSVFPDYTHDIIWVGSANGWLHQITGVFRGIPTEVTTGGFPVSISSNALSSPVYDGISSNVFVGDYGGFFYRVNPSTGAVIASGQVDHGAGLVAGPIVDATTGKVYVFSSSDGSISCPGGVPCAAVYLFPAAFGAGSTGTKALVGSSRVGLPNPNPLYDGGFDSNYFASGTATGNLYVCGNTAGRPILYRIPIALGVMGTVVTGPTLANATTACSPVTDIANPNATPHANEWIFASVQASGLGNACAAAGCIMHFVDKPWSASTNYVVGQQVIDTHFQVQTVRTAGKSRATVPAWSAVVGATTADNTVRWLNQGPVAAFYATWVASHAYALNQEIVDSNGNIQVVTTAGTSKVAPHPVWSAVPNVITNDGTARWRNVGSYATASLAATGGTSGMVMDNTIPTATLAGASQLYYSTLGNQVCGSSGTGGCAVQASQSALQ